MSSSQVKQSVLLVVREWSVSSIPGSGPRPVPESDKDTIQASRGHWNSARESIEELQGLRRAETAQETKADLSLPEEWETRLCCLL